MCSVCFFPLFSSCLSARLVPRCVQTDNFTPMANAEYALTVLGQPHPAALLHLMDHFNRIMAGAPQWHPMAVSFLTLEAP